MYIPGVHGVYMYIYIYIYICITIHIICASKYFINTGPFNLRLYYLLFDNHNFCGFPDRLTVRLIGLTFSHDQVTIIIRYNYIVCVTYSLLILFSLKIIVIREALTYLNHVVFNGKSCIRDTSLC